MSELRPVEEVAMDVGRGLYGRPYDETVGIIQADREAVVEACVDVLREMPREMQWKDMRDGIRAVLKPKETTRERLGRVARKHWVTQDGGIQGWGLLDDDARENWCKLADAIEAEIKRIEEEDDG